MDKGKGEERLRGGRRKGRRERGREKRKTGTAPETMNRQAKVRRLTTVCI